MDHLGFGLSAKPKDWTYDPPRLAGYLETVIAGLGLRNITLVVHDWGRPLGLGYALRRSEEVCGLVLINTWMWSSNGDRRSELIAWLLASSLYTALEDRFASTPRLFTRLAVGSRSQLKPDTHVHFEGPFRERSDRSGLKALVRGIREWDRWFGELWERREPIQDIPTLVIWGMKDPAFPPRFLERWEDFLTNATIERLSGIGHYPHEEAPEKVCDLIEGFLRRLE